MLIANNGTPPSLMMPYNFSYYEQLHERYGFRKAKDLLAYEGGGAESAPERFLRIGRRALERNGITLRTLDMKHFADEVELIKQLYNSAWEKNWGFVPLTNAEIDHLAKQLKPIVVPDLVIFAERGSEVVGFAVSLPDFNLALLHNRSGRNSRVSRPRHRRGAVPPHVGKLGQARDAAGRGRLDPRGQRPHEQGRHPARLPRLQDLPRLRQAAVNVFVTGATGFVGAHLVKALRARGDSVAALVRRPALAEQQGWGNDVRLVRGDLDAEAALRDGCAGADVVYHVAGKIAARNAAEFMATNRDGTANVLEAARDAGARRLLFVSSLAVAGPTTPGHPIDESRPPQPVTDYGRSKLAAEVLVRAMPASLLWTIVRPPVVYGEWDRGTLKIFQLARRGVVPVFGDGSQELSVIHAEDLARSLIAAATSPAAAGRVYFAAHPTTTTSRALVLAAGRAMGARGPRIIPVPPFVARGVLWAAGTLAHMAGRATLLSADKGNEYLAPAWTCRSDALTRDTGWQAEIALETGLRRAANWYREVGWL